MLSQEPQNHVFIGCAHPGRVLAFRGIPPKAYNVPWMFFTTDFQVKDGAYHDGKAAYTGYQLSAAPNPDFVNVVKSLFKNRATAC